MTDEPSTGSRHVLHPDIAPVALLVGALVDGV